MTNKAIFSGIFLFFSYFTTVYSHPDRIVIPFRIVDKMMVVQGTVNGRHGNLIIDTGIPKMLLNQSYLGSADLFTNKEFGGLQSVNGIIQNNGMSLIILQIGDSSIKIAAEVVNLQPIIRQKGMDILGIVGIEVFRKYELEIDYHAQKLCLYTLDKKGNRRLQEPQPHPSLIIPFQYQGHLPCITADLNGVILNLGLDTGTEINLLSAHIVESAKDQFKEVKTQKMMDLNGKQMIALSAQITGLQIGSLEMPPMTTLLIPLNKQYGALHSKNIQGLLGYEFFRHYRIVINFKKGEVYLWDQHYSKYPADRDSKKWLIKTN